MQLLGISFDVEELCKNYGDTKGTMNWESGKPHPILYSLLKCIIELFDLCQPEKFLALSFMTLMNNQKLSSVSLMSFNAVKTLYSFYFLFERLFLEVGEKKLEEKNLKRNSCGQCTF